jgi:hypothetical protein
VSRLLRVVFGGRRAMTEGKPLANLSLWVRWFTTRTTTRVSLRGDVWFDFLGAAVLLGGCAFAALYWQFPWTIAVIPSAWVIAGLWKLAAMSWLDRHRTWERLAVQPEPQRRPGARGAVLLALGVPLLALSGWRFWACLLGPDDSLWRSPPLSFAQESLRLVQEHRAKVEAIKAQGAGQDEYQKELRRYEAAAAELGCRHEEEMRADAPRWRWFEFGLASIALVMGLLFCWGGYKAWVSRQAPPEVGARLAE